MFYRFYALIAALIATVTLTMGLAGQASASPLADSVVPDTAACEQATTLDLRVQCATGLVNSEVAHIFGMTPHYTLIRAGDINLQLGLGSNGLDLCGYYGGVFENVFCGGVANLGEHDLKNYQRRTSDPLLGVALIAAHEVGHWWQTSAGANLTYTFMNPSSFPYEQSADCFAGFILSRWVEKGIFPSSALAEGEALFASIGGEGDELHGEPGERARAFGIGGEGDLAACGNAATGLVVE